jgi:hypothetical protein
MHTSTKWLGCQECDVVFQCYDGETKCIRLESPIKRYPSFPIGAKVLHIRSGKTYEILSTPDIVRIESVNIPAYAYKAKHDTIIWVRPQSEMEDGRFRLLADK